MHDHAGDDELLHTFRHLGIDLAKPRELNFYFVVPTEADADSARSLLAQKQLASEKLALDLPWWKRWFARPEWMISVTRTMPLGFCLSDVERDVLDALGKAEGLRASQIAQIAKVPNAIAWMEEFMSRLAEHGLDLIAPRQERGGEPAYVLRR